MAKKNKFDVWSSTASLVISLILACIIIIWYFSENTENFQDSALPETAKSIFGLENGIPIHCTGLDDVGPCLQGTHTRDFDKQAVWLGNSQLHAVNNYKPGQQNAPHMLFTSLAKKNIDLITISPPNASLQEHYILFEYLRSHISIDLVLLPVVFDDTREDGIRSQISIAFTDEKTYPFLMQTETGRNLLKNTNTGNYSDDDLAGLEMTMQQTTEKFFNNWLENNSRIWQSRPQARGKLLFQLYCLRNDIFGINAQSKRPKISGRYINNLNALELILSIAQKSGIKVLVYIAPIRDDVELPYFEDEYAQFKIQIEQMANKYRAAYENFESIIPAKFWGLKDSTTGNKQMELDFMHFQTDGHRILANELIKSIDRHFLDSKQYVTGE